MTHRLSPDRRGELPRVGNLPHIAEFDRQSAGRDGLANAADHTAETAALLEPARLREAYRRRGAPTR